MTTGGARRPFLVASLLVLAMAATAIAQGTPPERDAAPRPRPRPAPPLPPDLPGTRVKESDLPLMFSLPPSPEAPATRRPMPPLTPEQALRLRRAQDLRLSGLPERARDTLLVLNRAVPHHAGIVSELARAQMARGDWAASVSLLRGERQVLRDSLLGSRELELSLERLARPRDAAGVAVETWAASVPDGQWALPVLLRLMAGDANGVTGTLRASLVKMPGRGDLARGLALVLARQGQPAEAARALAEADHHGARPSVRQWFAEEAAYSGLAADSAAATEALLSLAADPACEPALRIVVARRAAELAAAQGRDADVAGRLLKALEGVPTDRWGGDLLLSVARGLRQAGRTGEAQSLLGRDGELSHRVPELAHERLLAALRERPSAATLASLDTLATAWPPARFTLAEAQFFAGETDSALANYTRVAADPQSPHAVAALDRAYLLEEQPGAPALRSFGTIAWERWRGDAPRARALADTLARSLPRTSPFYAPAALQLAELRADANDWAGALAPLAMVADSLPENRLAPVARQRAGEAYLKLGDERHALEQFEECLARYPRAWNAPEVRRRLEQVRRDHRF